MKKSVIILVVLLMSCLLITGCWFSKSKTNETEQNNTQENTPVPVVKIDMNPTGCGDGVCSKTEVYSTCPEDCIETCGNGQVEDNENWKNCRYDLMKDCGDGVCDEWEHFKYCAEDCEECIDDSKGTSNKDNVCPVSDRWVI